MVGASFQVKKNGDLYLKYLRLASYPSFECYFYSISIRANLPPNKADKITETNSSFKSRWIDWQVGKEGWKTLTNKWLTLYFLSKFLYCTGR